MACSRVLLRKYFTSPFNKTWKKCKLTNCCLLAQPKKSIHVISSAGIYHGLNVSKRTQTTLVHPCKLKEVGITCNIESNGKILQVSWKDGFESRFHAIWLRNNCHCPHCKQAGSGQKMIDVSAIDPSIQVIEVRLTDSDDLILQWSDNHIGEIPLDFLRLYCYEQPNSTPELSTYFSKKVPAMDYEDVLSSKHDLLKWLKHINTAGVCILKNVPTEDQTVTKVAELISPVQKSIYGTSFDVVSTPNPINVAYSSAHLDFHMDLIYYESAPGLQLLHCMRFDSCVEGGESLLLDIFHVAENFRRSYPVEFNTLSRVPATFQKIHYERESPVHMIYQKPHIMLNHRHEIVSINWAPAFEGPLSVDPEDVELYYKAYHTFAAAIQNSPAIIELKMKPGDLMIFNNRRILHGRKEFNLNGGVRHLQGCYVNIDEFKSKVYVLSNQLGDKEPIKRVGNQCWF